MTLSTPSLPPDGTVVQEDQLIFLYVWWQCCLRFSHLYSLTKGEVEMNKRPTLACKARDKRLHKHGYEHGQTDSTSTRHTVEQVTYIVLFYGSITFSSQEMKQVAKEGVHLQDPNVATCVSINKIHRIITPKQPLSDISHLQSRVVTSLTLPVNRSSMRLEGCLSPRPRM